MNSLVKSFRENLSSGDFLGPMLIKELRQGMKTRMFVSVFMIVQGLLAFAVIYNLIQLGSSDNNYDPTASVLFWGTVGVPLLLIIPLLGVNSVSSEIKAGTLDLLYLTRLSAWKIVFGKWFSLFAQTLLLLTAVLPYVVLRYFLGGVNVVEELIAMAWIVAISAALTAVTVGVSGFGGMVVKGLIGAGFFLLFIGGQQWIRMLSYGYGSSYGGYSSSPSVPLWAETVLRFSLSGAAIFLGSYLFLEFGAAAIAPPAENHALRKRLAGLLLLFCAAGFNYLHDEELTVICLLSALFVVAFALLENEVLVPTLYKAGSLPFGVRHLARCFYPGWCTASLYSVFVLIAGIWIIRDWLDDYRKFLTLISLFTSVVWGAAIVRLQPGQRKRPVMLFVGLQIVGSLLALMFGLLESTGRFGLGVWLVPMPIAVFWHAVSDEAPDAIVEFLIFGTSVVLLLCYGILRWRASPVLKRIIELEKLYIASRTKT